MTKRPLRWPGTRKPIRSADAVALLRLARKESDPEEKADWISLAVEIERIGAENEQAGSMRGRPRRPGRNDHDALVAMAHIAEETEETRPYALARQYVEQAGKPTTTTLKAEIERLARLWRRSIQTK